MANTNGTFRICKEVKIDYRNFISDLLSGGLSEFNGYGFRIEYKDAEYWEAKDELLESKMNNNPTLIRISFEETLAQMIMNGNDLIFVDEERVGEYTSVFRLDKVEKALWKFLEEDPCDAFILAFDNVYHREYDAGDCDVLLQYILFGDIIFG